MVSIPILRHASDRSNVMCFVDLKSYDHLFFFFSSRRRHTRSDRDWSSDVCSSDLEIVTAYQVRAKRTLDLSPGTLDELRTGMIDAVNGAGGTGHAASLDNVEVAGKTEIGRASCRERV